MSTLTLLDTPTVSSTANPVGIRTLGTRPLGRQEVWTMLRGLEDSYIRHGLPLLKVEQVEVVTILMQRLTQLLTCSTPDAPESSVPLPLAGASARCPHCAGLLTIQVTQDTTRILASALGLGHLTNLEAGLLWPLWAHRPEWVSNASTVERLWGLYDRSTLRACNVLRYRLNKRLAHVGYHIETITRGNVGKATWSRLVQVQP